MEDVIANAGSIFLPNLGARLAIHLSNWQTRVPHEMSRWADFRVVLLINVLMKANYLRFRAAHAW
jgi:hypothetical protein